MPRGVYDRSKAKPRRKKKGVPVTLHKDGIEIGVTLPKARRGKPKKQFTYPVRRIEALQILIDVCKSRNLTLKQAGDLLRAAILIADGG